MKKYYQLLAVLFILLTLSAQSFAQNNLLPGHIAIVSYQSDLDLTNVGFGGTTDYEDRFSIVVLKPGGLAAGTVIYFTDRGWDAPNGTWLDNATVGHEGVIKWVVPAGGIAGGTEVYFISHFNSATSIYTWSATSNEAGTIPLGVVTSETNPATDGGGMNLTVSGDEVLVYQTGPPAGPAGAYNATPIRLVTALLANLVANTTTSAGWDATPVTLNESSLPPGLVNGQTAFVMSPTTLPTATVDGNSEPDNGKFTACSSSNLSSLQWSSLIYTVTNWTYSNSVFAVGASSTHCTYQAPTAAPSTISGVVITSDGSPLAGVTVNLSGGDLSGNARTITNGNGQYRFENVKTGDFYTVTPARANYNFSPAQRSFNQLGQNTDAAFTASSTGSGLNPLDTPEYFVRQHYLDFLGREPDQAGFNFWSNQILGCGADAGCIEQRTINVSAAYFLSIEFQETGGLVDGLYRASYGRAARFAEFMPDTKAVAQGVVVGEGSWAQTLAANKQAFVDAWVQRPAFRAAYDGLSSGDFVDTLISHTGVSFSPAARAALVSSLNNQTTTRADVLREVAENDQFTNAKRNEAFVMMQYFGYLRRDPDASGYAFWLNKLNEFNGNFAQAEMVKAFIVSGEFRDRFPR